MQKELNRITVVHLLENMNPGGLERITSSIAQGLNRDRFAVEVWCLVSGGAMADDLVRAGIGVRILGITDYHNPSAICRLVGEFRRFRPHIVHAHGYFAGTIGRIAAVIARVPVVVAHVHSTYWEYGLRHLFMECLLSHFTSKVICCSNAVAEFVRKRERVSPARIQVVYNGVAMPLPRLSGMDSLRTELRIEPGNLVVGTVASLVLHKGHRFFIEAAARVLRAIPEARALIVGDGPCRKSLEEQAAGAGIASRTTFTGYRSDITELLAAMDVFVLASTVREGLSVALIEAMAMRKPAVATAVGGIPEVLIDGQTGYLVPPADADSLANAVINLLKYPEDAALMGKTAFRVYEEKFTLDKMMREIEGLYEEELQSCRRRGVAL